MLEALIDLDTDLLIWIHDHLHSGWLNSWVPLLREKWLWVPVYIFLILFMAFNFRRTGMVWVLLLLFAVGLADTTSSKVIKRSVKRLRPCHVERVEAQIETLIPCGGKYAFTSSHAANHFAVAFFVIFTLGRLIRGVRWPALVWAAAICFAQVYVGVHYPLDVLGGAVLGFLIASGTAWYFNSRWRLVAPAA
ncbi:MAG: phosphatase PAP2 family protein [Saprospiraceae bacterium]|nr:phosphatase PAP2 family protein [Saprospiraceae bacterium]